MSRLGDTILIATRNPGKAAEIRDILSFVPYKIVFPNDVGISESSEETRIELGETFEANARFKAEYFARRSGLPTAADDSGIEVFALGGLPGIKSRRFALFEGPPDAQDQANNTELLRKLSGLPQAKRRARYRCVVSFIRTGALPATFEGACNGRILEAPEGNNGFGYDPLFWSDDLETSFGLADPTAKHQVSHRGRAFRKFAEFLQQIESAPT